MRWKRRGEVEDRKEKHSRESKLFFETRQSFGLRHVKIEEFETYFLSLFSKAREKVGDSMKMKAFDKLKSAIGN